MIEKYRKGTIDIEDVEREEYDFEFDTLFHQQLNGTEYKPENQGEYGDNDNWYNTSHPYIQLFR